MRWYRANKDNTLVHLFRKAKGDFESRTLRAATYQSHPVGEAKEHAHVLEAKRDARLIGKVLPISLAPPLTMLGRMCPPKQIACTSDLFSCRLDQPSPALSQPIYLHTWL